MFSCIAISQPFLVCPAFEEDRATVSERLAAEALIVDVDGYEGPLDLLLTLSRTQKVDLRKISVLALAEQYLAFVERVRALRLELAADYLVMAAWLAYLKSRLLLPPDPEEDGPSGEDLAAHLAFQLERLQAMQPSAVLGVAKHTHRARYKPSRACHSKTFPNSWNWKIGNSPKRSSKQHGESTTLPMTCRSGSSGTGDVTRHMDRAAPRRIDTARTLDQETKPSPTNPRTRRPGSCWQWGWAYLSVVPR